MSTATAGLCSPGCGHNTWEQCPFLSPHRLPFVKTEPIPEGATFPRMEPLLWDGDQA